MLDPSHTVYLAVSTGRSYVTQLQPNARNRASLNNDTVVLQELRYNGFSAYIDIL